WLLLRSDWRFLLGALRSRGKRSRGVADGAEAIRAILGKRTHQRRTKLREPWRERGRGCREDIAHQCRGHTRVLPRRPTGEYFVGKHAPRELVRARIERFPT